MLSIAWEMAMANWQCKAKGVAREIARWQWLHVKAAERREACGSPAVSRDREIVGARDLHHLPVSRRRPN